MVRKPQNFSLNLIQLIGVLALLVIIAIGFLVIRINLPDVYLYVMGGAALLLPSQLYKTFEPAVRGYLYRKEHKNHQDTEELRNLVRSNLKKHLEH